MTRSLLNDQHDPIFAAVCDCRRRISQAAEAAGRQADGILLEAVTKTVPFERVNLALEAGVDLLGENRVQECVQKAPFYRCDPGKVHFIGHLQTNKIRDVIDRVSMVESVDSLRLAGALNEAAGKRGRILDVLIQVNIGREETKGGFLPEGLSEAVKEISAFPALRIRGLMAIPPRGEGDLCFGRMEELYQGFLSTPAGKDFSTLSMGMTEDFETAVKYGSTLVRVGRGIFGQRS